MRKLIILSIFLSVYFLGYSQIEFINYSTANTGTNGLLSNYVKSVCKDNDGKYWFGYEDGISVIDGENWKAIYEIDGVPLSSISCIFKDSKNKLWLSSRQNHLFTYDGNTWTIIEGSDSTFNTHSIKEIIEDKYHNIWMDSDWGVSRYDGINWTNYNTLGDIYSLATDTLGNIWAGTNGRGVFKFDGNEWINYTEYLTDKVEAIYVDGNNNIWFGASNGIWKFDGTNWNHISDISYLTGITGGENGEIYVSSLYNNTGFYKFSNNTWTYYNTSNSGIISNSIVKMTKTDNKIWLFSSIFGICSFNNEDFTTLTCDGLIDNGVNTIYQDNNNIYWFGTNRGISTFDNKIWNSNLNGSGIQDSSPISGIRVWSINQTITNAHIFATDNYVSILEYDAWTNDNSFPHQQIFTMFKDHQDNLWYSTMIGMTKYDNSSYTQFRFPYKYDMSTSPPFQFLHFIFSVAQDSANNIYAADSNYGLRIYDGNQWKLDESFGNVNAVFCDLENNTWIGTKNGLFKKTNSTITHLTTKDGLISDIINSILVDNK